MWKHWPSHPTQHQPWKQGYGGVQPTTSSHIPTYSPYPPNIQQLLPGFTPSSLPNATIP